MGIGAGHLMRLVAIAQEWMDRGGRSILLASSLPRQMLEPHIVGIEIRTLASEDGGIPDQAHEVAGIATAESADWIAIDGYRLDDSIENTLASSGCLLMAMDDFGHATHSSAELVVFPHAGSLQDKPSANRLEKRYGSNWELSGLKYVPVRNEFHNRKARRAESNPDEPFRIVVTMGAADPGNMTELVCEAIGAAGLKNQIELDVVLGPDYRHRFGLAGTLESASFNVVYHNQIAEPGRIFATADLVVSAGGSTLYDLACLGIPAIALEIAGNQRPVIRSMVQAGCAVTVAGDDESLAQMVESLVCDLAVSPNQLREMKAAGPLAVDGCGAGRIVQRMRAGRLIVRPANSADCEALWRLRNDPQVRANSCSMSLVEVAEHQQWLAQILADPSRYLFVLESAGGKISGQCRLDIDAKNASGTISVSLTDEMRGCSVSRGVVSAAIGQVISRPSAESAPVEWIAWIRSGNKASLRLFESLGFAKQGSENRTGGELLKYCLTLPSGKMNCVTGDVTPEFCHADQA